MINLELEEYAENHSSVEEDYLYELSRVTHLKARMTRMLSGKLQGKLLKMLSQFIQPTRILEIGTYTGYSALCLALGLKQNGELITIDKNPELEFISREFFDKSGFGDLITLINGDAIEVIPTLDGEFDLVFIDADKANYLNYYNLLIDRIPKGGYIIADNVLWSGKVLLNELKDNDQDTKGIKEFNDFVHNDPRVDNLLLPFRDGLMILKKI